MWRIARIYEPKVLSFFMRIAVLIVIIISTRVKLPGVRDRTVSPQRKATHSELTPARVKTPLGKPQHLQRHPPKDCKLASNIPTHPGRNLLREEKVQTLVLGMEKSPFRAVSYFLRQYAQNFLLDIHLFYICTE